MSVYVCVWFALSSCTAVTRHEKNTYLIATGHRKMMKTHKGENSVIVIVRH